MNVVKDNKRGVAVLIGLFVVTIGCARIDRGSLTSEEIQAIKTAAQAYGSAWLSNDPEQVMSTLTPDAVIVPSGMSPIEGEAAIRAFWWPRDSPSTTVTQFTSAENEIGGHGDFGFVRGTFTLSFQYDGTSYSSGGTYVSLLTRLPDDTWRISYRMWSDTRPPTE